MQDVEAERLGRAPAADQAVGLQRDRRGGGALDPLGDGQQIVVVDRELAHETQARAVVPAQRDRVIGPQLAAVRLPHGIRTRHRDARLGGNPAELDEIGVRRAGRVEQRDVRRIGRRADLIVGQHDMVEASAGQRERAVQAAILERHALAARQALLERAAGRHARDAGSNRTGDNRRRVPGVPSAEGMVCSVGAGCWRCASLIRGSS